MTVMVVHSSRVRGACRYREAVDSGASIQYSPGGSTQNVIRVAQVQIAAPHVRSTHMCVLATRRAHLHSFRFARATVGTGRTRAVRLRGQRRR
jgi:hypothetical protein